MNSLMSLERDRAKVQDALVGSTVKIDFDHVIRRLDALSVGLKGGLRPQENSKFHKMSSRESLRKK